MTSTTTRTAIGQSSRSTSSFFDISIATTATTTVLAIKVSISNLMAAGDLVVSTVAIPNSKIFGVGGNCRFAPRCDPYTKLSTSKVLFLKP